MNKIILLLLTVATALSSCSKGSDPEPMTDPIIGKWQILKVEAVILNYSTREVITPRHVANDYTTGIKYYYVFKDSGKGDIIGEQTYTNAFDFNYTNDELNIEVSAMSLPNVPQVGWKNKYKVDGNKLIVEYFIQSLSTDGNPSYESQYFVTFEKR